MPAEPDPIFALIEQHRVAHDVRERCDDGEKLTAVNEAAWAIEDTLARTRPTTLAGILAIMRYECELSDQPLKSSYDMFDFENREGEPGRLTIRTWLITLEQSITAIAGADQPARVAVVAAAPSLVRHPDAALFDLERKLDAVERKAKSLGKAHTRVEEIMIAWRKENPRPAQRKISFPINGMVTNGRVRGGS
jgi:hypothetical protein